MKPKKKPLNAAARRFDDADYLETLSDSERDYYTNFINGYYGNGNGAGKAEYDADNARRRDIMSYGGIKDAVDTMILDNLENALNAKLERPIEYGNIVGVEKRRPALFKAAIKAGIDSDELETMYKESKLKFKDYEFDEVRINIDNQEFAMQSPEDILIEMIDMSRGAL